MSSCKLDHSNEEVRNKLHSQRGFIPATLFEQANLYLQGSPAQDKLNELFHLLKKYDLVSAEEQMQRDLSMMALFTQGYPS